MSLLVFNFGWDILDDLREVGLVMPKALPLNWSKDLGFRRLKQLILVHKKKKKKKEMINIILP